MENNDMNLFDFFRLCWHKIVDLFKWVGLVFIRTVRLCLQYIWVVLPCAVLGVLGGWLWAKESLTKFEGRATILYAEGMQNIVEEHLIDFLCLPGTVKEEKYGIPLKLQKAFDKIETYNVIDVYPFDSIPDFIDLDMDVAPQDTMTRIMKDRTYLVLKMNRTYDFLPYQKALEKYFNETSSLVEIDKKCKKIREDRLNHFRREYARLDSFASYDYFIRPRYLGAEWGNLIISEREQELYYQDLMCIARHKEYLEGQVLSTPNVINFQTPFIRYEMPHVFKYIIGLFVGGMLGILLSLLIKYWKNVVEYMKKK